MAEYFHYCSIMDGQFPASKCLHREGRSHGPVSFGGTTNNGVIGPCILYHAQKKTLHVLPQTGQYHLSTCVHYSIVRVFQVAHQGLRDKRVDFLTLWARGRIIAVVPARNLVSDDMNCRTKVVLAAPRHPELFVELHGKFLDLSRGSVEAPSLTDCWVALGSILYSSS